MASPLWSFTTLGILCLATAAMTAFAAPVSAGWAPVGGPAEPWVVLHLDPGRPDLLYARVASHRSEAGYLWRSEDAGATWRNLQTGLQRPTSALAIDPTDPKVIWVWTTQGELWRSGDAGDTWVRRFTAPPRDSESFTVFRLLVDPRHPGTLFRVDYDGSKLHVSVSRDDGASFHEGAGAPSTYDADGIFLNAERGELVAFGYEGIEVSADGGQTWSLRGRYHARGFWQGSVAPSNPDTMYAVPDFGGVLPANGACLVRSDDAGAHWQKLAPPPLPPQKFYCDDIVVDPKDARHIWVIGFKLGGDNDCPFLFESKDGGQTWSGGFCAPTYATVAAGGERLYTSDGSFPGQGLHGSQDGGRTWKRRDQGILAGEDRSFVAQRLPGGGAGRRLLVGSFRSDGGKEWVNLPLAVSSLADAGGSVIVATDYPGDTLRRSRNGGETWRFVASAPSKVSYLLSDLAQPRYLGLQTYKEEDAFGDTAFWTSDDGGATWRQSRETACAHILTYDYCLYVSAYAVDPFNPARRWMAGPVDLNSFPVLFTSKDAGVSWQAVASTPTSISTLAADPSVKDRVLAGTRNGLFVSEDGGEHWRLLGQGLPEGAVIRQFARDARSAIWYAATVAHGIYRSLDGGSNWQFLAGAPDSDAPRIAIDPRGPAALLAVFRGQGVWRWTP